LGQDDKAELLLVYEKDKLAATSVAPRASQVATWLRFLELWHGEAVPGVPVEPEDIAHVGSIMKARGYRSFSNYVTAMKIEHVKAGFAWSAQHELECKQGIRSVTRGQGPPRQAAPLVVDDVLAIDTEALGDGMAVGAPINPRGAFFIGTAFMLREIELAYARLAHLRVDKVKKRAVLELPVSKTDPTAVGCMRVWGCVCDPGGLSKDCVYHAAEDHLRRVHLALGIAVGDPLALSLPLFPDSRGNTVTKAAVTACIERLATLVGEPLEGSLGQRRFGGHSLRVSGAQWLGHLGFSVEQVRTFGRWASDTVIRYLGEAHVSDLARARRRFIREQALLEGQLLAAPAASGPSLQTAAEVERLVQNAICQPLADMEERVAALRVGGAPAFDLVLHERYQRVHCMACDLASPAASWQTQCGWKFAQTLGWRLAASSLFRPAGGWRRCGRCVVPLCGGEWSM
jgi:hypothetical protein